MSDSTEEIDTISRNMAQKMELPGSDLDLQLAVESALDPRSAEFQQAIKLTPATLAHYRTDGKWIPVEHLLYISAILAHELSLGDARIIIEVPPRHGKSELDSVHTPTWFLEKFPWAHVILATYAADFAEGFGRRVRDGFLENPKGILNTKIRDDVQRVSNFLTNEGGSMTSIGIGGQITGRGAHLLLIDDFIKNWKEASSETVLRGIWDWFITSAYTRLEPGGSCVILATRWVIGDLIGLLKEQDKNHMWTVIHIPAIAEEGDPLNRKKGEALWPARYPIHVLEQIRSLVGEFIFQAMYQQNPKEPGEVSADVDQIKEVTEITQPQFYRWVRSWDLAASDTSRADWTVGTLIGTNARAGSPTAMTAIADMVRGRWLPAKVETEMRKVAEADGTSTVIVIEQEPGSSGKSFAQHLATNVLRGFVVHIKPPAGHNKWIRAQPYIAAVSHGRILMLRAAWNSIHKGELKPFPNGKFDDTVDSTAQGFNELHLTKILTPTWGRRGEGDPLISTPSTGKLITGVVFGRTIR